MLQPLNRHARRAGNPQTAVIGGSSWLSALIGSSLVWLLVAAVPAWGQEQPLRPNVIVIYADDLGWGDLGCYGHPTIRTPNLDRMAAEGLKLTSFYSAAEVCTPSRAALLTGRYPLRSGMCHSQRRVLFTDSPGGIPDSEVTLAEALAAAGYQTACVGKWHLGHFPQHLPIHHGFETYYGIPYSNDMDRIADRKLGRQAFFDPKVEYWNPPLMRGNTIVERPAEQHTLTKRYTEEAVTFLNQPHEKPYFLYFAHNMPHVPLFASDQFAGKSPRGLYGDVIEELDWSVGQILETLRTTGQAEKTLVVFSSDNGPWLIFDTHGGSAGPFRDGKGGTWEGGMRVPGIFWWPGQIPAGRLSQEIACTMDIYATAVALAGGTVPDDRVVDGVNLWPLLSGAGKSPREEMMYYRGTELFAARKGRYKAHYITQPSYGAGKPVKHDPPELYDLGVDPGEKFNIAAQHPEVLRELESAVERHKVGMVPGENQLAPSLPFRN